jgi:flagellar biosynthesis protein FliR
MSQLTLSQLIKEFGGGAQVTGFFLVLARVSPLFVLAPLFSSKIIPARVRGIIAVALAIGLTPVAAHGQHVPTDPLQVAGLMVVQVLVGLAFAFSVSALITAVQTAGGLADIASGFSFGATIDPINGNQGGAFARLYMMIGTAMFIAIGGDAWMLRGISRTFTLVPLTKSPQITGLVNGAEQSFASIFVAAIEVAAPVLLALLITDVAFGMVSRAVPQLNVFSVALPLKVGVAMLVVAASLPFLGGWMSDQIYTSVGTALHSLKVA